ncbi:MAG TPA: hypothetical protein VG474_13195 [Solirubrobacteraceae bacterium]|nr:hypothetical protein [Solirubrobacteraceae bacterium]
MSIAGKAPTLARASRAARRAGSLTLTFRLSPRAQRVLTRTIERRRTRRTGGVAQVVFEPVDGTKRTRNRSLSIAIGT